MDGVGQSLSTADVSPAILLGLGLSHPYATSPDNKNKSTTFFKWLFIGIYPYYCLFFKKDKI